MPFDGVMLPTTAINLMTAKGRVEKGWCKNYLSNSRAVCALGALIPADKVYCDPFNYVSKLPEATLLLQAMGDKAKLYDPGSIPGYPAEVARYNNDPATTKEDILALYDIAIELAVAESFVAA